MENASRALLLAASTLIAIMILSLMVYMFKLFGNTAHTTDRRLAKKVIDAFNAKFSNYVTMTQEFSYNKLFNENISNASEDYKRELKIANQSLNTCYDVVTCINDAINVNYQTNNRYTYSGLEIRGTVEVIVDLEASNKFNFSKNFQYLVIEPNKAVKDRNIYGIGNINTDKSNTENKEINVKKFNTSNPISVYDMLEELRATKIITVDGKSCTVYKYYFLGETFLNDITGQIETVKFKLIENKNFDKL